MNIKLNLSLLKQPKVLIIGLILIFGISGMFFLYSAETSKQAKARARALNIYSEYVNEWLSEQQKLLKPLLDDPRLAGTGQDTLTVESRKALYEFRYAQNLKDMYLMDTRNGNIMRAPETLPLPSHVKNYFSPENTLPFHALLVNINNAPFFLSAQKLNYPESREPIYAIAAQPINAALKKLTSLQSSIKDHKLGLLYKGIGHQYIPYIHQHLPKMFTAPQMLYSDTTTPIQQTILFQDEKLITTLKSLENYPEWEVVISTAHVKPPYIAITLVLILTLLCALVAWFHEPLYKAFKRFLNAIRPRKAPKPKYDYASFTSPDQSIIHEMGRSDSSTEYAPSAPKVRKTLLNPTSGNFKIWDNVQDSLKKDRAVLHYQPIINLSTNAVYMYEVFLRVLNKEGQHIPPARFLPAMEHYHAAGKLDTYVLDKVITSHFPEGKNIHHCIFNINLTGQAFDALGFLSTMMEKMPDEILPYIVFELRHHEIRNDPAAKKFLTECSDMGLRMAVDYFGGGENMLKIAKRIGFSWVKVTKQALKEEGLTLQYLAEASRRVEMPLILERIETEEELKEAQKYGIDLAQGYFIGKPKEWEKID